MPKSNGFASEHSGSEQQLDYLYLVWAKLWRNPLSWPFKKPVRTERLALHDYHKIIKYPMDLSTIKHKLLNNEYTSAKQAIGDFSRMILNCLIYNDHTDDVVIMAKSLLDDLNEALKGMPEIVTDSQTALTPGQKREPAIKIEQEKITKSINVPLLEASSTLILPPDIVRQSQYNICGATAKAIIARSKKKWPISKSDMARLFGDANLTPQVNIYTIFKNFRLLFNWLGYFSIILRRK